MAVDSSYGDIVASTAQPEKCPGIQVVGDQISDSTVGKTCHQCRQKIKNFAAVCKNQRKNKPCAIRICHKCLMNRYGEIAEEVAVVGDWSCPKCRGICNCSVCMKRRGHQPTGALSNTAKANGFTSVSEMLVKGAACVNDEKVGAAMADSPKKEGVASPRKRGKENSFDGKVDGNVPSNDIVNDNISSKITNDGHKRETKKEGCDNIHDANNNAGGAGSHVCEKKHKKMKRDKSAEMGKDNDGASVSKKNSAVAFHSDKRKRKDCGSTINAKNFSKQQDVDSQADIPLPVGTELTSVAGIDLQTEDIGNALQFLEFCSVFGKILGVRKGQPELVLQDLFHGRAARRGKYSVTVQFHILLLSVLRPDHGERSRTEIPDYEKSSWFQTLKKCLSKSKCILKAQVLDSLKKAADYETLDASEKLRVLNILCDEILGTERVRSWIVDQNRKFAEQVKETKQKERSLKQKTKNCTDKAIIPKDGDSHSISEQVETSCEKSEAAQDQTNMIESKDMLLMDQTSEPMRIGPVFLDCRGHAYWKLNCSGKPDILHQNIGKGDDSLTLSEKWCGLGAEEKYVIEKYISFSRQKRRPTGV